MNKKRVSIIIFVFLASMVFSCSKKSAEFSNERYLQEQNAEKKLHELIKLEKYNEIYYEATTELKNCYSESEFIQGFQKLALKLKEKDAGLEFKIFTFKASGFVDHEFCYRVGVERDYADECGDWVFEGETPKLASYSVTSIEMSGKEQAEDFIHCAKYK